LASARASGAPGRSVKSDRDCRPDVSVRCARVRDPNGSLGSLLEPPGCVETVVSDADWCRSARWHGSPRPPAAAIPAGPASLAVIEFAGRCAEVRAERRLCPLRTAAPVDRAPRTERPVLAHTLGGLRCHRGYLPADMGTKVVSAAARWLLFCPSGARKTPTDGSKVLDRFWSANRLVLTTCRDVLT
jgi:hypothetical protein